MRAEISCGVYCLPSISLVFQSVPMWRLTDQIGRASCRKECRYWRDWSSDVCSSDLTGLLGGLALRVLEVGRHGDDGVGDRLAQVGLGVPLELLQDARADLLRRVLLAVDLAGLPVGAHVALDRPDGAVDVGDRLVLRRLPDEHLAVLGEGDDRRGGARTLGVRDDRRLPALEDGDDGVGGAEVDADRSCHGVDLLLSVRVVVQWSSGRSADTTLRGVRSTFLPRLTARRRNLFPGRRRTDESRRAVPGAVVCGGSGHATAASVRRRPQVRRGGPVRTTGTRG